MKNKTMKYLSVAILLLFATTIYAQVPAQIVGTFIQDHANVLTPDQRKSLEVKVRQLEHDRNTQLGVVTVPSTNGMEISEFNLLVGRTYGIGARDGEHRGIVLLLAVNDRKYWIQPSRHLEAFITDGQAGTIGRSMVPYLRNKDYNGALNHAVDELIDLTMKAPVSESTINSDQQNAPQSSHTVKYVLIFLTCLAILGIFFAGLIYWFRNRDRSSNSSSDDSDDYGSNFGTNSVIGSNVISSSNFGGSSSDSSSSSTSSFDSSSSSDSSGFGGSSDFGGGGAGGDY